ncbi:hypothetical protein HPP92_018401 [Vanilla planifolia]|uniref:RING-type E3 ubiquitin transferase n=1 Tax=Vanilla planifolia TaxID=51239 RepID=A0A835UPG6_VANPL|nr:hypothetical protein HPP92_018401 [Vanilla planifolia]
MEEVLRGKNVFKDKLKDPPAHAPAMDHPLPPPPSRSSNRVALSGLMPPSSLIESLLQASAELAAFDPLPFLQTRNTAAAIQRARIISSLLEDLHHSAAVGGASFPPSSILCLTELLSVVRRIKALLKTSPLAAPYGRCCSIPRPSPSDSTPAPARWVLPSTSSRSASHPSPSTSVSRERLREELFCIMARDRREKGYLDFKNVEDVLRRIGLHTAAAYQEEIKRLEAEIPKQAGTGGLMAVSNINILITLVSHAKAIIFNKSDAPVMLEQQRRLLLANDPSPRTLRQSTTWSVVAAATLSTSMRVNIPDEFRCPITLDLMKEPVIVASGHTYDRSSISRWINSGHHTCPKSGQKLSHMALIPNYALKNLIEQWCKENNLPAAVWQRSPTVTPVDHISETRSAVEAVRMTAEFLVGKLAMGSPETQRQAAYELRLLAKTGMDNRRIIAEAGAIPFLVMLLASRDPRTQENAVTALLNLSIFDNNKMLIMAAGAVDAIVDVLRAGAVMEARENAAATIFSLAMTDEGKATIGKRPEAVVALVALLREGTTSGKRDAATALLYLSMHDTNKPAVVAAGAVPVLVELLMDEKAGITDEALSVLALLCSCEEGMREIGESRAVLAILVDLMRFGSPKGKENSIAVLLGLCKDGGVDMGRRLLMNARSVPSLQSLAANGSPKARRKADALLRLLNRICSNSNHVS